MLKLPPALYIPPSPCNLLPLLSSAIGLSSPFVMVDFLSTLLITVFLLLGAWGNKGDAFDPCSSRKRKKRGD